MRRITCLMMATLAGTAVSAQGLLDCIDPDVLHSLLLPGQNGRSPVVTATLPQELTALRMPAAFSWIGSAERPSPGIDTAVNATQVTAAWRSTLEPDAAQAAAAAALTTSGWEVRSAPAMSGRMFSFPDARIPQQACRDGGAVSFSTGVLDGVTYVLLTLQRGTSDTAACNGPQPRALPAGAWMEPYLPRLEVPLDATTAVRSIQASYGGNAVSSSTEIVSGESAASIARHFARQLAGQGWTSDATWNGAATTGSAWVRRTADGARILGTLTLMTVDRQRVIAVLRVTAPQ